MCSFLFAATDALTMALHASFHSHEHAYCLAVTPLGSAFSRVLHRKGVC